MVSMPRCGCQGNPARYSCGRSLRKSSSSRNGSNSVVSPKPKARRRCTPAPSIVGFDETMRLTGRMDMVELPGQDRLGPRTEGARRHIAVTNVTRLLMGGKRGSQRRDFVVLAGRLDGHLRGLLRAFAWCPAGCRRETVGPRHLSGKNGLEQSYR